MPNNELHEAFKIDNFEPRQLKSAQQILENKIARVEEIQNYTKNLEEDPTLWYKIKHLLHMGTSKNMSIWHIFI